MADRQSVFPVALVGAVGTVPAGVSVAQYLGNQRGEARGWRVALGAGVVVGVAVLIGTMDQQPPEEALRRYSGEQATEFRAGYTTRIRERRRNALFAGAAVGTALGVAVYALAPRGT